MGAVVIALVMPVVVSVVIVVFTVAGVSRQRVNQALQVLSRDGLLDIEYGSVRIRDLARLRRYGS